MKIFHIYLFLTFCPHLTDIMMSLKDLSDGNTGQVVEAIVVKEVKPVVIIIHDGKTLGVVLVAEDPDRKYTKGGQGLQVIKNEVLQNDPLVLRRDPLLKIVPGKVQNISLFVRYYSRSTISHACRIYEIFHQNDNISWLQIS